MLQKFATFATNVANVANLKVVFSGLFWALGTPPAVPLGTPQRLEPSRVGVWVSPSHLPAPGRLKESESCNICNICDEKVAKCCKIHYVAKLMLQISK